MTYDGAAFLALVLWGLLMAAFWGLVALEIAQWIARRWQKRGTPKYWPAQQKKGWPADGSGEPR